MDLGQRLTGARVTGLGRRAKYGLIDTDRGDTLVFHLGMSGQWRVDPTEIEKHDHLMIETDDGRRRGAERRRGASGRSTSCGQTSWQEWPPFAALGPEPLDLDARELKRRLAGRTAAIKLLLLDQRIIAGLGNIYVCEALYRAGIHPAPAPADRYRWQRLKRLVPAIHDVLAEAIEAGGSTLARFCQPGRGAWLFLQSDSRCTTGKGRRAHAAAP